MKPVTSPALGSTDTLAPRSLSIEQRLIAELKFNPRNPRIHTPKQVRQIARSIAKFGFNIPVVIDRSDQVLAGHGRVLACQTLGLTHVPTIRIDHLSPEQASLFAIADNKLNQNGGWDQRMLAAHFAELSELDLDVSLDISGFSVGEIDLLIEGLDAAPMEEVDPRGTPPFPSQVTVSQRGDLWILGRHRVYCGNALDQSSYTQLLQGRKAVAVIADVPYNVKINGHASGNGAVHHREFPMASGEMTESQFCAFLTAAFRLMANHSVDGSLAYVFMDWAHQAEILAAGREVYSELKAMCVWVKPRAGLGSLYRSQHELVFVFKHGSAPHINNVLLGRFGRDRSNVWRYSAVNALSSTGVEGDIHCLHPTMKPVELVADAILDCSDRNVAILDPFLGSGTTLIASEKTGRRCFGIELDPGYVDTSIHRWQRYTGLRARHAQTGRDFDDMERDAMAAHRNAAAVQETAHEIAS